MAPSILEQHLDEFGLRYWESCEEVLSQQTCHGMYISRLSSPLSVPEVPESESGKNAGTETKDSQTQKYGNYGNHRNYCESRNSRAAIADNESVSASQSPVSPLPVKASPTVIAERSFTKLKTCCPKTSKKGLRSSANMGNPFYKKSLCLRNEGNHSR